MEVKFSPTDVAMLKMAGISPGAVGLPTVLACRSNDALRIRELEAQIADSDRALTECVQILQRYAAASERSHRRFVGVCVAAAVQFLLLSGVILWMSR